MVSVTKYLHPECRVVDQPIFKGLNLPAGAETGHRAPAGLIAPGADRR